MVIQSSVKFIFILYTFNKKIVFSYFNFNQFDFLIFKNNNFFLLSQTIFIVRENKNHCFL